MVSSLVIAGSLAAAASSASAHSSHATPAQQTSVSSYDYRLAIEVANVKAATMKYLDYRVAERDGFINTHEFAAHPQLGGMGIHFVNPARMGDNKVKTTEPEVLLYEPNGFGGYNLIAVEYYVPAALAETTPTLFGRSFDGPMLNHDLDPNQLNEAEKNDRGNQHYDMHVWVWKHNPSGLFAPFNPSVKAK